MKNHIDLISSHGILRLIPLEDGVIRVQFKKGMAEEFEDGYWNYKSEKPVSWTAKEGKNLVVVDTGKITVRIDKRTGALQFFDKEKKLLLAEKAALPRQIESDAGLQSWVYFDWQKSEKISVKGITKDDWVRMDRKARYISFGKKTLRMPLLISENGYGIGVAAERTVMCCMIPTYGNYLYTEGSKQIDYYFLYGGNYDMTLELYKKL